MDNKYDARQAIKKLQQRGIGNYVCPFCQGREFSVQEQLATISISDDIKHLNIGHYIPSAILVCSKCGNLSFFALAALGMLEKGDSSNGEKD